MLTSAAQFRFLQAQVQRLQLEFTRMSNDFTKMQAGVQALNTTLLGLQAEITKLQADIPAAIQAAASSGASDQPTIDAITSSLGGIDSALGTAVTNLTNLDASLAASATPPAPAA